MNIVSNIYTGKVSNISTGLIWIGNLHKKSNYDYLTHLLNVIVPFSSHKDYFNEVKKKRKHLTTNKD